MGEFSGLLLLLLVLGRCRGWFRLAVQVKNAQCVIAARSHRVGAMAVAASADVIPRYV